jgi:hypothetical protein
LYRIVFDWRPLGAIIRKGGLGLPVVVSVIFFLIYYIIGTIGEKSAKEGDLSPLIGAWISIVVLFPIGLFLTYKAATDSALFDADIYKRFLSALTCVNPSLYSFTNYRPLSPNYRINLLKYRQIQIR